MRPLSDLERSVIERIASKLNDPERSALLSDLKVASVERAMNQDASIIEFALPNYSRPAAKGQSPYGVEGEMCDEDGEKLSVIVFADANDRLYELEFIRWADGDLIAPQLDTLKLLYY